MTILVHAKPSASRNAVERITDSEFTVYTTQPPISGRANRSIIELLADYMGVHRSRLTISAGRTSREKTLLLV